MNTVKYAYMHRAELCQNSCMTNSSLCQYSNNLSFIIAETLITDYPTCFFPLVCLLETERGENSTKKGYFLTCDKPCIFSLHCKLSTGK